MGDRAFNRSVLSFKLLYIVITVTPLANEGALKTQDVKMRDIVTGQVLYTFLSMMCIQ